MPVIVQACEGKFEVKTPVAYECYNTKTRLLNVIFNIYTIHMKMGISLGHETNKSDSSALGSCTRIFIYT